MRISILCSDEMHPVVPWLKDWRDSQLGLGHDVDLHYELDRLDGGDMLFLISCSEYVGKSTSDKYAHVLVIHASDLPLGRGWSPHIWDIVEGADSIVVSLIEAATPIDSGRIWLQECFKLAGHELFDEINDRLFATEVLLMSRAVMEHDQITPKEQVGEPTQYRRKRTPADSELDAEKSIAEQFDSLRVADPERYPAFFEIHGRRYKITIEKLD